MRTKLRTRLFWSGLLIASGACHDEPKAIPYYSECQCECSAAQQPCVTRAIVYCDVAGQTAHYEQFLSALCADYQTKAQYFNCALADVGQPGEPSKQVTSILPFEPCDD